MNESALLDRKINDSGSYNLCHGLLMDEIGHPKALGLYLQTSQPRESVRGANAAGIVSLTGGGSMKSPLGKGRRTSTVK